MRGSRQAEFDVPCSVYIGAEQITEDISTEL